MQMDVSAEDAKGVFVKQTDVWKYRIRSFASPDELIPESYHTLQQKANIINFFLQHRNQYTKKTTMISIVAQKKIVCFLNEMQKTHVSNTQRYS
jgi:hypothetical protein